jgi:hypothetical protein
MVLKAEQPSDPSHLLTMWQGLRRRVLDRTRADYYRALEACDHEATRGYYWLWQILGKAGELVAVQVQKWTLEAKHVLPHEYVETFGLIMDQCYGQVQAQEAFPALQQQASASERGWEQQKE